MALRAWAKRGRISAPDRDRIAMQFLYVICGELRLRVLAGPPADDPAAAIVSNVDPAQGTFWSAIRLSGTSKFLQLRGNRC